MLTLPWSAHPCSLGYHIPAVLVITFLQFYYCTVFFAACKHESIVSVLEFCLLSKINLTAVNWIWCGLPTKPSCIVCCLSHSFPRKHAGFNSEAFWFWPLRPVCCQTWAGLHMLDPTSSEGLFRFWTRGSGPEASQCARIIRPGSDSLQPAYYQFPIFRLICILPEMASIKNHWGRF